MPVKKALAFAREAGGVAAVSPVCKELVRQGWDVLVFSKDNGRDAFARKGISCMDLPIFDGMSLEGFLKGKWGVLPGLVLTSAASLPTIDMTEKLLWRWASSRAIPSVAILDQWQNYALRFSGPGADKKLEYMPDTICVMDELARREMLYEGLPDDRLAVTGQPAFDGIRKEHDAAVSQRREIRKRAGISDKTTVVMFVAEALKKDFGTSLGYDEISTVQFAGKILDELAAREKTDITFMIRLHPENKKGEFDRFAKKWSAIKTVVAGKELAAREAIAASDLVVGMTSVMLLESIISGVPTVSLQINSRTPSHCVATKANAIPFITTEAAGKSAISSVLCDVAFRKRYLDAQKSFNIRENATDGCVAVLNKIISGERLRS